MATSTNTPSGTNVTTTVDPTSAAPAVENTAAKADADGVPNMDTIKGIRYVGRSNKRSISVAEFLSVGVDAKHDLSWDDSNARTVEVGQFNAAVRDYLAHDPEFEIV